MYHFPEDVCFLPIEMSSKMRSLDREARGLKMEKEDIERVSLIVENVCISVETTLQG